MMESLRESFTAHAAAAPEPLGLVQLIAQLKAALMQYFVVL
jgi:hypothetical protein